MVEKRTRPRGFPAAGAVLALAILAAACAPNDTPGATETPIAGTARVLDGMTIEIAGTTIRLFGIDAPDLEQTCERKGRTIPCGNVSRTALMDLVAGSEVICTPAESNAAGSDPRIVAACSAGGFDIGNNMVHTGWALADPKTAPRRYRATGAKARKRQVGLWRTNFDLPWVWRANRRAGQTGGEICVRGRLTEEGAECPALRDAAGVLYTIGKRDIGFKPGQEVCVCGRMAEISFCMQGKTLAPNRIGPASSCP